MRISDWSSDVCSSDLAAGKMRVGYFTQYQVEELDGADTPLGAMTRVMAGKAPGAVRGQLGRFGFTGNKATTQIAKLSGGERARLALALITRERSEEHTSELQSLMRISYAVFCLKKKTKQSAHARIDQSA